MLILDTDHFSAFIRGGQQATRLKTRLAAIAVPVKLSIVCVEEQCRGWLAQINKARTVDERHFAYGQFHILIDNLKSWSVLPWSVAAEVIYERLQASKTRVGTMDLRMTAITMSSDGTLLSRNLRDFQRVPGLGVEDWLDE